MKTRTEKTRKRSRMVLVALPLIAFVLVGCTNIPSFTGTKGEKANPYIVKINFDTADDCKVLSVDEETTPLSCGSGFCLKRNEWVVWHSEPAGIKYEIFFNPIVGVPLKSWRNGYLVRPIDRRAPEADYKYSIVRDGCKPNEMNTFDPHIRVNN